MLLRQQGQVFYLHSKIVWKVQNTRPSPLTSHMPCPKGNLLVEWSSEGQTTAQLSLPRVFGAAALPDRWLASGEQGELWQLVPGKLTVQASQRYPHHWDNHLTVV